MSGNWLRRVEKAINSLPWRWEQEHVIQAEEIQKDWNWDHHVDLKCVIQKGTSIKGLKESLNKEQL